MDDAQQFRGSVVAEVATVMGQHEGTRRNLDAMWAAIIERVPKAEAFLADPETRAAANVAVLAWQVRAGYRGPEWGRADLFGENGRDGFVQRAEKRAFDLEDLAEDAWSITQSFHDAADVELSRAAFVVFARAASASHAADELLDALERFREAVPAKGGGRGKLSAQARRKALHLFAEEIRDLWTRRGLSLGGNGQPNDGFGDFLLAVYNAVTRESRESLPNGAALLARLRNDWPGPNGR